MSAFPLTVPNLICLARLCGAPFLILLAARDQRLALVGLCLALALSDWLDGKLAILLDQRSKIGPLLDTIADLAMYLCLLVAVVWIDGDRLRHEAVWLAVALVPWLVVVVAGFVKFHRWPTLHTRSAKIAWLLIAIGAITFLTGWAVWPLRIALIGVTLANIHAFLILQILPTWHSDVPTMAAARRLRDRAEN